MMENGRLSGAELAPIPGGELSIEAAAAWNAPGGPADADLLPKGPESSYRTVAGQQKQRNYWCGLGKCENAAEPGHSNHGLGVAVDLKEEWMRAWIDEHGAEYGWRKTEAPTEWWHVNYVGGVDFPTFELMKKGSHGKRVERITKRLAFIHKPHSPAYLERPYESFKEPVEDAVKEFQKDQGLEIDGVIGPKTAARINAVFHRQYEARGGKGK
jgi:peptidoglycan hydrolase-like protein with peptidoglycan-binding domain